MSITRALKFVRRPWNTPQLPGLPDGYWVAAGSAVGDASGGEFTWQHIWAQPSTGLGDPSSFFSVEQWSMTVNIATDRVVEVLVSGMDPDTGIAPDVTHSYFLIFRLLAGVNNCALADDGGANQKLWIGRYGDPSTGAGVLNLATPNTTASNFFRVKVQGFYWGPGAMNAPGGIIRPPNGIYGA